MRERHRLVPRGRGAEGVGTSGNGAGELIGQAFDAAVRWTQCAQLIKSGENHPEGGSIAAQSRELRLELGQQALELTHAFAADLHDRIHVERTIGRDDRGLFLDQGGDDGIGCCCLGVGQRRAAGVEITGFARELGFAQVRARNLIAGVASARGARRHDCKLTQQIVGLRAQLAGGDGVGDGACKRADGKVEIAAQGARARSYRGSRARAAGCWSRLA